MLNRSLSLVSKAYSKAHFALVALAVLAATGSYAQVVDEPVEIVSLGVDYGGTAANFGTAVGTVVIAALGFMMALAVVHVFRRWVGAKKA